MYVTPPGNNQEPRDIPTLEVGRGASSEVVEHALDVLLCFLDAEGELGVSEISRRLGIEKGRVHRFLMAFRRKGLIAYNPRTRRYSLGFRVLELSSALTRQFDVVAWAQPFLRELREATGETASLAVRVGDHRVHLAQVESEHEMRQTYPIGKPVPLYAGSSGKALMAFLPPEELERLLSIRLQPLTDSTMVEPDRLRGELAEVRRRGYAISMGERTPGSQSIAAPVWSWRGDVMAINSSGPAFRFTPERAAAVAGLLYDIAARLTRHLGGEPFAAPRPAITP